MNIREVGAEDQKWASLEGFRERETEGQRGGHGGAVVELGLTDPKAGPLAAVMGLGAVTGGN